MANFNEALQWTSSKPYLYLTVSYGKRRSGADMIYSVNLSVSTCTGSKYFGYPIYAEIFVNGEQSARFNPTLKNSSPSQWSNPINYNTGEFTISNKTTGTTALSVRLYSGSGSSRDKTFTFELPIDPASFSQTPSLWFISGDETSSTFGWSTTETCDKVIYHLDGGNVEVFSGSATSGTFTISGLTAGSNHSLYCECRRADSGISSNSNTISFSTYAYPNYSSMANFTIGQNPTINIYNPLGRTCTVSLLGDDDSVIGSTSTSGTSVSNLADATKLYQSIPNKKSANCKVKVEYSGNTSIKTGAIYSINENECIPVIGSVSYQDTFADSVAITGDNQIIISGISKVQLNATNLQVKHSATISKVEYRIISADTQPLGELTISGTSASISNQLFNNEYDTNANKVYIRMYDSRGLYVDKLLTLDLRAYHTPYATYSVKRQGNFYSNTDFLVNADYSAIGTNAPVIKTRYKKVEDSTWSAYTNLTNNITTTISLDNNYMWNIEIVVSDAFESRTYTTTIQRGMPILFVDTKLNSVGINCFPSLSDSFEVNDSPINTNFKWGSTACGNWFGNTMYRNCYEGNLSVNLSDNTFFLQSQGIGQTPNIVDVNIVLYDPVERIVYKLPHYDKTSRDNDIFSPEYWIYDGSPNDDYLEVFGKGMPAIMQKAFDNEWTYKLIVYYTKSVG